MAFNERIKGLLNSGKELAVKAGNKAQDIGEMGFLAVDKKRLEGQEQKHLLALAEEVYTLFIERGQASIEQDTPAVKTILDEIAKVKGEIKRKDTEIAALKGDKPQ